MENNLFQRNRPTFNWADENESDESGANKIGESNESSGSCASDAETEKEKVVEKEDTKKEEWQIVQRKRRPKKYITGPEAKSLELTLHIKGLAKCLTSNEAKEFQRAGFKFEKVVPISMSDSVRSLPNDSYRHIIMRNKWKDIALFRTDGSTVNK